MCYIQGATATTIRAIVIIFTLSCACIEDAVNSVVHVFVRT